MSIHAHTNQLQYQIQDGLRLPPNQFQIFLQKLHTDRPYQLCQIIAQMQLTKKQSLSKQKQQKLSTSLNFLIQKSFKSSAKNPELWQIYLKNVATVKQSSHKDELAEWKLSKITQKSFKKFVQSFQQQLNPILQQFYFKMNTSHKILLQNIIVNEDVDQHARILFLRETFGDYVRLGLEIWQQLEMASDQKTVIEELGNRMVQYLNNLKSTLNFLNVQSQSNNEQEVIAKNACLSNQLFSLINSSIFLEFLKNQQKNYPKLAPKGSKLLPLLFTQQGSYQKQQCLNNIKALGLEILNLALCQFSNNASLAQFDQSKILSLMENLVPSIVEELQNCNKNKLQLPEKEKLAVSMLCTLRKSLDFLFMNNYYFANYRRIFWKICYPLLGISDQEKRQFQDEPEYFIGQAQTLSEKDYDDPEKIQSCKTYAGFLLEAIIDHVDGALTCIANQSINAFCYGLIKQQNESCRDVTRQFNINFSMETTLTILQVLTPKFKKRQQLMQKLRKIFIQRKDQILALKKLQRCRLIIFLCYIFDDLLPHQQISIPYFTLISQSLLQSNRPQPLPHSQTVTKLCLSFYQTYCSDRLAWPIFDVLIDIIETTRYVDVLEVVAKVLYELIGTFDMGTVGVVVDKTINRVFGENREYIRAIRDNRSVSNLFLIKGLDILRIIALYCKNMKQNGQQLMGYLWRVFDLFQDIYDVNYGEDLIKIFDAVLSYVKVLDGSHFFQFLPSFAQYHKKQKQIGRLFYTYLALMIKGQQYLQNTQQGNRKISQICQNLLIILRFQSPKRSLPSILLLQYMLLKFPHKIDHHNAQIFNLTLQLLESDNKHRQNEELASAIYNLWIIGSILEREGQACYDLGLLDRYEVREIYGYQARVFGIAVFGKICQLVNEGNPNMLTKVIYLMKKAIQFLKAFQSQNKNKTSKTEYKIEQISKISPNEKLRQTFVFLKANLPENNYQQFLTQIQHQIPRQQLKTLLNKATKQSRVIFKFK